MGFPEFPCGIKTQSLPIIPDSVVRPLRAPFSHVLLPHPAFPGTTSK